MPHVLVLQHPDIASCDLSDFPKLAPYSERVVRIDVPEGFVLPEAAKAILARQQIDYAL